MSLLAPLLLCIACQVVQLKWALRVAAVLNRTLILPPKLPHRSPVPSIGRCERYPIRQARIRQEAWVVYMGLLRSDVRQQGLLGATPLQRLLVLLGLLTGPLPKS